MQGSRLVTLLEEADTARLLLSQLPLKTLASLSSSCRRLRAALACLPEAVWRAAAQHTGYSSSHAILNAASVLTYLRAQHEMHCNILAGHCRQTVLQRPCGTASPDGSKLAQEAADVFLVDIAAGRHSYVDLAAPASDEPDAMPAVLGWSSGGLLLAARVNSRDKAVFSVYNRHGETVARVAAPKAVDGLVVHRGSWVPSRAQLALLHPECEDFQRLWLWQVPESRLQRIGLAPRTATEAVCSPSGDTVLCLCYDGVCLVSLSSRAVLHQMPAGLQAALRDSQLSCCWGHQGVAVQSSGGSPDLPVLRLYEMRDAALFLKHMLEGGPGAVQSTSDAGWICSPDGAFLLGCSSHTDMQGTSSTVTFVKVSTGRSHGYEVPQRPWQLRWASESQVVATDHACRQHLVLDFS